MTPELCVAVVTEALRVMVLSDLLVGFFAGVGGYVFRALVEPSK